MEMSSKMGFSSFFSAKTLIIPMLSGGVLRSGKVLCFPCFFALLRCLFRRLWNTAKRNDYFVVFGRLWWKWTNLHRENKCFLLFSSRVQKCYESPTFLLFFVMPQTLSKRYAKTKPNLLFWSKFVVFWLEFVPPDIRSEGNECNSLTNWNSFEKCKIFVNEWEFVRKVWNIR